MGTAAGERPRPPVGWPRRQGQRPRSAEAPHAPDPDLAGSVRRARKGQEVPWVVPCRDVPESCASLLPALLLGLAACGDREPASGGAGLAAAPFSFRWQFSVRAEDERGEEKDIPVVARTSARTGAPVALRLGLDGSCRVYVIASDAEDAVRVLYPEDPAAQPESGFRTLLREGSRLDPDSPRHRFTVLAAREPLEGLEARIRDLEAAPEEKRPAAARALQDEVRVLRERHERLDSATVKPANIGGTFRGPPDADEITATGVYCRTYVIETAD